jgi:hypothetical protein
LTTGLHAALVATKYLFIFMTALVYQRMLRMQGLIVFEATLKTLLSGGVLIWCFPLRVESSRAPGLALKHLIDSGACSLRCALRGSPCIALETMGARTSCSNHHAAQLQRACLCGLSLLASRRLAQSLHLRERIREELSISPRRRLSFYRPTRHCL